MAVGGMDCSPISLALTENTILLFYFFFPERHSFWNVACFFTPIL